MLISPAFAQDAGGGAESGLISLLPLVLIFVVFYFLLIRPQQKKMKAHRGMVEALRRGDKVVTSGGIVGTVTKVTADSPEMQVEIADGVRVKVMRHTIQEVMSKPDAAGGKSASSAPKAANDEPAKEKAKGGMLGGLFGGKSDK
ncbi:MAG: preprotein translocase subunit YajC [Pseudomonadota bacterium]